jgi:hypothetical protein
VGLERGLENRDYCRGDPLLWPRDTLYQLKLALTSPTGCGRSVGIVRLRTKTTEFSFFFIPNNFSHKPANLNVLLKLIILCVVYFLSTRGGIKIIIRPRTFVMLYPLIMIYIVLSVHSDPLFSFVRVRN